MPDPVNPRVKLRARTSASLVEVPAETPDFWQPRDVPHGAVEINWQKSKTLQETRWIWIYTPPGYEKNTQARYPRAIDGPHTYTVWKKFLAEFAPLLFR